VAAGHAAPWAADPRVRYLQACVVNIQFGFAIERGLKDRFHLFLSTNDLHLFRPTLAILAINRSIVFFYLGGWTKFLRNGVVKQSCGNGVVK